MAKLGPEIVFLGTVFVLVLTGIKLNFSLLSMLARNSFEEPRFEVVRSRDSSLKFGERSIIRFDHNNGLPTLNVITSAAQMSESVSGPRQSDRQDEDVRDQQHLVPAASLKGGMVRYEPRDLDDKDRIIHHVVASFARAKYLHGRMFVNGAAAEHPDWASDVTSVAGGYSMPLSLGSPPQTFQVMVDTGSDLTWVQSRRCTHCFQQPSNGYQADISSTYKGLQCSSPICQYLGAQSLCFTTSSYEQCDYSYSYGDQSTTFGRYSTELLTMSNRNGSAVEVPNFAFGVATDNVVNFGGVDGILGLGQGPISFPKQLGDDYGNKFSYCLQGYHKRGISPIIFGESAVPREAVAPYSTTSWPDPEKLIQYTPLKFADNALISTFWFLNLQGLSIEGRPVLAVPQSMHTFIDSGTTISMLAPELYTALKNALVETVEYLPTSPQNTGLDLCFNTDNGTGGVLREPNFPNVTFTFELADWVLPRDNTFIEIDHEGTWCLTMIPSTLDGLQIFGNLQQANFHVVYDRPKARLGFVPANCNLI